MSLPDALKDRYIKLDEAMLTDNANLDCLSWLPALVGWKAAMAACSLIGKCVAEVTEVLAVVLVNPLHLLLIAEPLSHRYIFSPVQLIVLLLIADPDMMRLMG